MRIAFLPQDVDGAGCYRCIFPAQHLAQRGHDVVMPRFVLKDYKGNFVPPLPGRQGLDSIPPGYFDVGFLGDEIHDVDLVVIHAAAHVDQLTQARRLQREGSAVVVDLDDTMFELPSYSPARRQSTEYNRRWQRQAVEMADLVTVATDALAEFYSRWNQNIVVLRNRLHWPMWEGVDKGAGWKRFRVGYMGNMDYHSEDLRTIAPQLRKWLERNPEVEFVAAGDPRIHDVVGTPEAQRVCTSSVFFRNLDLWQITATMDVGLVPLVKNRFNECKSWLKGSEYAACGIPCIASPTAEYRRWLGEGRGNGFLAKHPKDWIERLDDLANDHGLVQSMGIRAEQQARHSSLDHYIHEWEAAYDGITGGGHHAVSTREIGVAA